MLDERDKVSDGMSDTWSDKHNMLTAEMATSMEQMERRMEVRFHEVDDKMAAVEKKIATNKEKIYQATTLTTKPPTPVPSQPPVHHAPVVGHDLVEVLKQLRDCVRRTEQNDRKIATAWVGLIASLLLIPIAFLMGKFF